MNQLRMYGFSTLLAITANMLLWLAPLPAQAWTLGKDLNGIRVWSQPLSTGSGHEIKSEGIVNASPDKVVVLLTDYSISPSWRSKYLKAMDVMEHPAPDRWIIRVNSQPPWPLPVTHSIIETQVSKNDKTGEVTYSYRPRHDLMEKEGVKPLGTGEGEWRLTPAAEGKTSIVKVARMSITAPVPKWLIESMLYDGPYEELMGMRQKLTEAKYSAAAPTP